MNEWVGDQYKPAVNVISLIFVVNVELSREPIGDGEGIDLTLKSSLSDLHEFFKNTAAVGKIWLIFMMKKTFTDMRHRERDYCPQPHGESLFKLSELRHFVLTKF